VTADAGAERFSRVFDVLELLVGHPQGMTLTEIVKRLGLPASSAHNLLQRMAATDVVAISEDLRYSVGSRAVRLGIRIVDGLEVRGIARRVLQDLSRDTGEDVYLAVRLGTRVSYIDRVPGTRPIAVDIRLGQSLFLHATAVGKLFAAFHRTLYRRLMNEPRPRLTQHTLVDEADLERELETIRRTGYSVSREEGIAGIVGYAFPVRDAYGEIVAAIHISAPLSQVDEAHEKMLIVKALEATASIEADLGRGGADLSRRGRRSAAG
jgi:DNA-binding IclR family transcriptional regulator